MIHFSLKEAKITYSPDGNFLRIINKKIGLAIQICNKECQHDVNGKEAIDNVVYDE